MTHETKPLVVIDTINAAIHLDNDNDNSEVGEVIAAFKQEFKGVPVLLIAHLAKGLLRSEVESLTARGAGAWEADAHQVLYLVKEQNGTRWLDISYPKHRFHADADGITFKGVMNEINTTDLLGNPKKEKLIHGKPSVIVEGGKQVLKEISEQEKKEREQQLLSEKIYKTAKELLDNLNKKEALVKDASSIIKLTPASEKDTGEKENLIMADVDDCVLEKIPAARNAYITANEIFLDTGGNKQVVLKIIKSLVKLDVLIQVVIPKEEKRNKNHTTGIKLPIKEMLQWDITAAGTT